MIVLNPTESNVALDEILVKGKRIFTSAHSFSNDSEKLAACRTATMFFSRHGLADIKIGDMMTVVIAVSEQSNAVYVLSPIGWVNVTNATALELAEVSLGIMHDRPTARQVFNPTGSLLGDLFMAVLAGVGEAVTKTK
ncbi:hypothetical protein [Xanthomonas phage RTH11]|nr:hypothetical protein [Xanthomonas phage RTH11]